MMATIEIGITTAPLTSMNCFKISFNMFEQKEFKLVVTGPNVYKYYKLTQDFNDFQVDHTQVNNSDRPISKTYSCHAWMQDTGRLIVCTEQGEIMLMEANGEFLAFITESPMDNFNIRCIAPFSRGFLIAGDNGTIHTYERVEDPKFPYKRSKRPLTINLDQNQIGMAIAPITSIALTQTEDLIFLVTENNQMMKVNIALDGTDD
jgi:hypothetical protein